MDIQETAWKLYAELRSEIREAQNQRVDLLKAKMTFTGVFIATIGTLARSKIDLNIPLEITYIPAFIATLFDLLIHSCSRKIYHIAQYLRQEVEPILTKGWNNNVEFTLWETYEHDQKLIYDQEITKKYFSKKKTKNEDVDTPRPRKSKNPRVTAFVILRQPARMGLIGSTFVVFIPTVYILFLVIHKLFIGRINVQDEVNGLTVSFPCFVQFVVLIILIILIGWDVWDFVYQYKRARD